ncbi:MAG: PPC domain-containing protein, partial [Myxococcota bacterium]|nr:PPC domain-containing protein [Myxococcota bacterium]
CNNEEYCDLDVNVCRPLSELPCTPDRYSPNQDPESASPLTLPNIGESRTETELSLCEEQQDWFTVSLSAGEELTITMTSTAGLTSSYAILAADGLTLLASGTLGPLGSELLRFTASRTDTYYLRVTRSGAETGFYSLTLSLAQGESCVDPAESAQGNDSGTTASLLFSPGTTIDDDCTRSTNAGNAVVECPPSALTLCDGDVDYYRVEVDGGSKVDITLSSFGGDLDLDLYGPFASTQTFSSTTLVTSSVETAPEKTVSAIARQDSYYVVRVYRDFGEETGYRLTTQVDPPPSACVEDSYEGELLNESFETAAPVSLSTSSPTEIALNLCIGDVEWLALGADGASTIPANHRLTLTMAIDGTTNQGSLQAGSSAEELVSATDGTLALDRTTASTYWVRIEADEANPAHQPVTLTAVLQAPPACELDDNIAPSTAVAMTSLSNAGDLQEASPTSSCPTDDDWYRIAVPAGLDLSVAVEYDASEVNLGLSLYDESVAGLSDDTTLAPPTAGLLTSQAVPSQPFQLVRDAAGEPRDVYVRVSNESGWTLDTYQLGVRLVEPSCAADDFEPNDSSQSPSSLTLTQQPYNSQIDAGLFWDLSSCEGNEDWFTLRLLPGDVVSSTLDFDSTQANLSLELFEEDAQSSVATGNGQSPLVHSVLEENPAGDYLMRVRPLSGQAPDYALHVAVQRACEDDALEPIPPATDTALTAPFDQAELTLCSDDDWYSITSSSSNLTVCALFDHDVGDIDLELLDSPVGSLLSSSLTKNDFEVVSVDPLESTTYYVRVFLDSRDSGAVSYRLVAGENINCDGL